MSPALCVGGHHAPCLDFYITCWQFVLLFNYGLMFLLLPLRVPPIVTSLAGWCNHRTRKSIAGNDGESLEEVHGTKGGVTRFLVFWEILWDVANHFTCFIKLHHLFTTFHSHATAHFFFTSFLNTYVIILYLQLQIIASFYCRFLRSALDLHFNEPGEKTISKVCTCA